MLLTSKLPKNFELTTIFPFSLSSLERQIERNERRDSITNTSEIKNVSFFTITSIEIRRDQRLKTCCSYKFNFSVVSRTKFNNSVLNELKRGKNSFR